MVMELMDAAFNGWIALSLSFSAINRSSCLSLAAWISFDGMGCVDRIHRIASYAYGTNIRPVEFCIDWDGRKDSRSPTPFMIYHPGRVVTCYSFSVRPVG